MSTLRAIDLPLGQSLYDEVRQCVDQGVAFCVVDQRVSRSRRASDLAALGATELVDSSGRHRLEGGIGVDPSIGLVMLTSGSSGTPKAAELEWEALRASAEMTSAALGSGATWLACLPPNHIGGLAVLLRAVFTDASVIFDAGNDPSRGPERGASHVAVVRAHLARHDLSRYELVLLGGARPPGDLAPNVTTTWGMTETGSGVVYDGVALDGVELAVDDGELLVRSPTLFRSYRGAPRPVATGPDGRRDWFPTGDEAEIHDGVLRVRGRRAFVINTGGEKVWPDDLEAVLAAAPGVRDVAITSLADDEWGERVVALVVDDGTTRDDELRDLASERIGPWARPKEIRRVVAIPRTSNGKIRRDVLPETR